MAIEQNESRYCKDLSPEQQARIAKQLIDMVDFRIEWVDDDNFYLHDVGLSLSATEMRNWVAEQKTAGEEISESIDKIVEVSARLMSVDPSSEVGRELRKKMTDKYSEVFDESKPPIPFFTLKEDKEEVPKVASYTSLYPPTITELETIASVQGLAYITKFTAMISILDHQPAKLSEVEKQAMVEECLARFSTRACSLKEMSSVDTSNSRKVKLTGPGEIKVSSAGCIGYNMGNNNVVVIYNYPGREVRNAEDEEKSAKSFWDRFCKETPNGSWKNIRLHVDFGRTPTASEDGNFHYSVALNRTADITFTPIIVS